MPMDCKIPRKHHHCPAQTLIYIEVIEFLVEFVLKGYCETEFWRVWLVNVDGKNCCFFMSFLEFYRCAF